MESPAPRISSPIRAVSWAGLILLSLLTRYALLLNKQLPNDYDQPSQSINYMKTDRRYIPNRHPGSPIYEMAMGIAYHKMIAPLLGIIETRDHAQYGIDIVSDEKDSRIHTDSIFVVIFKFFSLICGLIVIALMYGELESMENPWIVFLACLACLLHPGFIWMSSAWSEDIVALALGWMCLSWAKRDTHGWGIAVLGALAVGVKFTSVVLVIAAALRFAGRYSKAWDRFRFRHLARVLVISGGLSILFYMPAFIYFKMNVAHMLDSPGFGLSNGQRIWTGIQLLRSSLPYWIPLSVVYVWRWFLRIKHRERTTWSTEDYLWTAFTVIGLLAVQPPGWRAIAAIAMAVILLGFAVPPLVRRWRAYTPEEMVHPFIFILGIAILISEPFSRSYVLLFLPSLLILLARRFKSTAFWVSIVVLTYLPMFYFYILDPGVPRLTVYHDGFYACFLDAQRTRWNDINDFGYVNLRQPWIVLGREKR